MPEKYRGRLTVSLLDNHMSKAIATGTETEVRQKTSDFLRKQTFPEGYELLKVRVMHAITNYKDHHKEEIYPCSLEWHLTTDDSK